MVIDLNTVDGNAYALMVIAHDIAKQDGWGRVEISQLLDRMKAGTYADLLDELEAAFPGIDFEFIGDPRS